MRTRVVLPFAVMLALFALALGFAALPEVYASSTPGSVVFTPTSGPIGTSVQVFVHQPLAETTPVSYALGYTPADPATGGCASQQPFPGVAPFGSSEANGNATLNWPASLNKGPYWLCASPTSGGEKTVYSSEPYTVTAGEVPTATPGTTSGAIIVRVPDDGVAVGSTFTLSIRHWASPDGTPPQEVYLTSHDPSLPSSSKLSEYSASVAVAPGPQALSYILVVTVPRTLITVPGMYWAHVMDQRGGVYSGPFRVIAAATPVPMSAPVRVNTDGASSFPSILVLIVTLLVCICVLILTMVVLRRRAQPYR